MKLSVERCSLSVIMPVYNEEATVAEVIKRVLAQDIHELIVVDDGSTDGTYKNIGIDELIQTHYLRDHINHGKGYAIREGLKWVTGDVVIIQDADLEYDPGDYFKMLNALQFPGANAVYGVRDLSGQKLLYRLGNKFLTGLTNLLFLKGHVKLFDMETCYKMIRKDVIDKLDLQSDGFEIEAEITAKLLKMGYYIYQVPISYKARYNGKKLRLSDGFKAVKTLFKYWRTK